MGERPDKYCRWLPPVCMLSLLLFLVGCTSPSLKKGGEFAALVEAYKTKNAQLQAQRQQAQSKGIRELQVIKGEPPDHFRVSVDLTNALLPVVVGRVLDATEIPYLFHETVLTGNVTARFQNIPLQRALNLLLDSRGLSVVWKDNVLVFRRGVAEGPVVASPAQPDAAAGKPNGAAGEPPGPNPKATKYLEIPMKYIDMETVSNFLSGLFPENDDEEEGSLSYGLQPNTNTVFLLGPGDQVTRAAALLREADHAPAHVFIEALVVQFSSEEIEALGIDITNITAGQFSDVVSNFGSLASPAAVLTFTNSDRNITSWTATIEALVAQDYAHLVSRPYVSTLSGKEATITITRSQFVVVTMPEEGASITALNPIEAGLILKVTPTIMAQGSIRLVISIEDSQFVPTTTADPGSVTIEVFKNMGTTEMQVVSGETIIIGGLTRHQAARANSGMPWLRHVPLLNLFFAKQTEFQSNDEVVIYLTPYILEPSMETPLVAPDAYAVPEDQGGLSPFERFGLPSSSVEH